MLVLALLAAGDAAGQRPAGQPVAIFDGRTFDGWEGDTTIFRIQDGAIVGGTLAKPIARNEFLCTTRSYDNFELRLNVKLVGGDSANAGIQFRTKRIPNNNEVSGFQADMGQGYWGSLYDESRRRKTLKAPEAEAIKTLVKSGEWNDYVVRAEGPRIRLSINGVQTVDYMETDASVDSTGLICVQIHSGPPTEAWYKDIRLTPLK
jgi:hypothetical protein